jgi:hypothetical protein
MLNRAIAPVLVAVLASGCGLVHGARPEAAPPVASAPAQAKVAAASASAPQRAVGDWFVHRFSGSFSAEPLTLTEEVKAHEDGAWVVDFALTENEKVERLRVRFDEASGRAISAARLEGTSETPAGLADYEALMARTTYSADVNDGLVAANEQTCLVGADELDCETKTYKVWIGEDAAQLSVVHAKKFADRDVSGEITTEDGKLIYRAELLEARSGGSPRGVASR